MPYLIFLLRFSFYNLSDFFPLHYLKRDVYFAECHLKPQNFQNYRSDSDSAASIHYVQFGSDFWEFKSAWVKSTFFHAVWRKSVKKRIFQSRSFSELKVAQVNKSISYSLLASSIGEWFHFVSGRIERKSHFYCQHCRFNLHQQKQFRWRSHHKLFLWQLTRTGLQSICNLRAGIFFSFWKGLLFYDFLRGWIFFLTPACPGLNSFFCTLALSLSECNKRKKRGKKRRRGLYCL